MRPLCPPPPRHTRAALGLIGGLWLGAATGLSAGLGVLIGGLWLSPDLDIRSNPTRRWGPPNQMKIKNDEISSLDITEQINSPHKQLDIAIATIAGAAENSARQYKSLAVR
ncbi:MAG: hypothetical protein FJ077_15705 [Cyanobacteria bacterium K_DeepCast_35m_m2_023]|nr:hypothetical protein [Cyanobacteria bacterium K_DeepCast_35m_m2_023]